MALQTSVDLYNAKAIPGQQGPNFNGASVYTVVWNGPDTAAEDVYGTCVKYTSLPGGVGTCTKAVTAVDLSPLAVLAGFILRPRSAQNDSLGGSGIITTGDPLALMTSGDIYALSFDGLGCSPTSDIYVSGTVGSAGALIDEDTGVIVTPWVTPRDDTDGTTGKAPFLVNCSFNYRPTP